MDWAQFPDRSLNQGTIEWREARRHRIGGSDIPVILRLSPYKTRRELWEEKVGLRPAPDISHLPHVQRGIRAEPEARFLLEQKHKVKYTTPVLQHRKYPYLVASLDGLCADHILEIKTMGKTAHEDVARGVIPEHYLVQCEWAMMIAGKRMLFASYRPEDSTMHEIWIEPPSEDHVRFLLASALQFHRWIMRMTAPPPDFTTSKIKM